MNPDAIRKILHGQSFWKNAEPMVWASAKLMTGALFEAGHREVVIAAPLWLARYRNQWKDSRWDRRAVLFTAEREVCHQRANDAGRVDLLKIIDKMANQFEEPDPRREEFQSVERVSLSDIL